MFFDLHKLGWKAFEDLVACVLSETMGQTLQVFSPGADGGRDAAFYGTWSDKKGDSLLMGSFSVQCKHTSKVGKTLPASEYKSELDNVSRLAHAGLSDIYIFFTNYELPAKVAEEAQKKFLEAGAKHVLIFGGAWICDMIAKNPTLRRLVPRLYGLGDLTQIITNQAFRQATTVLDALAPELACFVPTDAYRRCAHALKKEGFVILIGEPASGKTMIANLMALSAADEWNLQTLMIKKPEDFDRLWNPDDPGQFFWVDDAFGPNQYDPERVKEWNLRLSDLSVAIRKGARAVFTSRSYIFKSAQNELNTHKFELFNESRVVIHVEELSLVERSMILYNHLKFGMQPRNFKTKVKSHLSSAVETPKFLPEVARRFGEPKFTKNLSITESGIKDFFSNPLAVMEDIIRGMSAADKAALALIFANNGSLPIPIPENSLSLKVIAAMRSNIGDVKAALHSLSDALIRIIKTDDRQYWEFHHPTIRDAFASFIGGSPEQIEIYISEGSRDRIISEVSCGDMQIEGVKVIVPANFFDRILHIIAPNGSEIENLAEPVLTFLAHKCSRNFLKLYFKNTETIAALPPRIRIANRYDAATIILTRLAKESLLPDEIRLDAVRRIKTLSENRFWDGYIDEDLVGGLLTKQENSIFLLEQKDVLYSNQYEIISEIYDNHDVQDDPYDTFSDLRRLIERFHDESEYLYGSEEYDEAETKRAQSFLDEIDENITRLNSVRPEEKIYESLDAEETTAGIFSTSRSIFDDVDE